MLLPEVFLNSLSSSTQTPEGTRSVLCSRVCFPLCPGIQKDYIPYGTSWSYMVLGLKTCDFQLQENRTVLGYGTNIVLLQKHSGSIRLCGSNLSSQTDTFLEKSDEVHFFVPFVDGILHRQIGTELLLVLFSPPFQPEGS